MKAKYKLIYIWLCIIIASIFLNSFKREPPIYQSISPVFLQQESNSNNVIFINKLVRDGKIISLMREEEELGEIIIDDSPALNKREKLNYFRTLGLYSIGEDVKELNISLYYLGYGTDKNSRVYSVKTKEAVKSFQKAYNLKVDGFAGLQTFNNINRVLKSKRIKIPNCEPNVQKVLSSSYWIVINKDANILKLYKGKRLVKKYPIATGKDSDDTPEGKFEIIIKTKNPYWGGGKDKEPIKGGTPENPLGTRWLGLDFGRGRWYGIHGTNNPRSIGKHVSNGCIRMYNKHVEELYRIVPKKTKVFIGRDKQINKYIY